MIVLVSQYKGVLPCLGQKLVGITLVHWCTGTLVHWYTSALQVGITPSCETLMCMFSGSTPATGKNAVRLFHFRHIIHSKLSWLNQSVSAEIQTCLSVLKHFSMDLSSPLISGFLLPTQASNRCQYWTCFQGESEWFQFWRDF